MYEIKIQERYRNEYTLRYVSIAYFFHSDSMVSVWSKRAVGTGFTEQLTHLQFEWNHPVLLYEYLLYYNMFPSRQLTLMYNINATCFDLWQSSSGWSKNRLTLDQPDDDCHKSKHVANI
jgi:hypothetical protein